MATDNRKIFFADLGTDNIHASGLSGGSVEDIITGLGNPYGVAVDTTNNKIYFTDQNNDYIKSANRDGSSEIILASGADGLSQPLGIAVDRVNQKLYCADFTEDKIFKLDTDGNNFETIASGADGLNEPIGIAVDAINNKLYWTEVGNDVVKRSNLDGSSIETIVTGVTDPQSIEVYPESGKIFWVNWTANNIYSADLDGQNETIIVPSTSGFAQLRGITIDVINDKIYFSDDGGTDQIAKCNFDGSNIEIIASRTGTVNIRDLDIDQMQINSGNIDLFLKTPELQSGSIDLFLKVLEFESNNLDLYILSSSGTSGNFDIFINGHETSSGNFDLFTYASDIISISGDLFISGPTQTSGEFDLTIINSGVINNWNFFLKGLNNDSNDDFPLIIYGTTTSGVSVSIQELTLFIQNSGDDVQDPPIFINNFPVFMKVNSTGFESGNWSAFLKAQFEESNSFNLYISSGPNVFGDFTLFIEDDPGFNVTPGFTGYRNQWSAFLRALPGSSSECDLFVSGIPPDSTSISGQFDLVSLSHVESSGDMDHFIFGISGIGSGSIDFFIVAVTGIIDVENILYTHGF
jgi:sugar lactone lactonase YvrE